LSRDTQGVANVLGLADVLSVKNHFTMLGFIQGLTAAELERTLGFHAGRLSSGFAIVALTEGQQLEPVDIDLLGSTRWSGGLIGSRGLQHGRELQFILAQRGQDVAQLKRKVCEFFSRRGPRTPAKVLPNMAHSRGTFYPDAEALGPGIRSGVPQFKLLKLHRFTVIQIEP
jgi:hypothetical protein